jgi:predicted PurR-regulated permease PerM
MVIESLGSLVPNYRQLVSWIISTRGRTSSPMTRYISFAVLLAIIVVIGAIFYKVMIGFFVPVFLAAVLVVIFRPLHRWVLSRVGERDHLASSITTTLIMFIVLLPAGLVLSLAAVQGVRFVKEINTSSIELGLAKIRGNDWINLEYPQAKSVRAIQEKVSDVQSVVTSQKSISDLTNEKGQLQGDIKEIERLLNEDLAELLKKLPAKESERKILKARRKQQRNSGKADPGESGFIAKMRPELEEFFGNINKGIADNLRSKDQYDNPESNAGESSFDRSAFDESIRLLRTSELTSIKSLSPAEIATVDSIRKNHVDQSVAWYDVRKELAKSLDQLKSDAIGEKDIVQLQKNVLELTQTWTKARETILGGPIVAVIKEFANPSPEQFGSLTESFFVYISPKLLSLTGDSFAFLIRLAIGSSILLVSLYFFLCDGPAMVRSLMELSPLDDKYELELLAEFDRVSRAIVLATILSALAQGLTAGLAYYVAGLDSMVLLIALTSTCALIPFVGTAIIWVPVCLYLAAYQENYVAAIGVALWGFFVVGSVDNLVKIFVLHGQSQLHPLLALLSVLGGIQALGPVGILVGPMVVVLLQTLLGILRHELARFNKSEDEPDSANQGPLPLSERFRKQKRRDGASEDEVKSIPSEPSNPTGLVEPT